MLTSKRCTWIILFTSLCLPLICNGSEEEQSGPKQYRYTYIDREHSLGEDIAHLGILYPLGWIGYYITQKSTFNNVGSWETYKDNFGRLVFDKDEPLWNWLVHPMSGSQMYLYFRANGYSRLAALRMTAIEGAIFEFTTEIWTEKASVQDLYQTPIFGSLLGLVVETSSMALLNSDNSALKIIGHIINPATLFWFYEGKVLVTPNLSRDTASMEAFIEF